MGRAAAVLLIAITMSPLARAEGSRELRRACDAGDPSACLTLAEREERDGRGKQALELYDQACDGRIARACGRAGALLENGKLFRSDPAEAADYYQRGCKLRDGLSCKNLSTLHYAGRGVKRSVSRAFDLLDRACGYDYAQACDLLGRAYFAGEGVKRDTREAERFFRLACEGGHEQACSRVQGVASPSGSDRARRARDACDTGDALACVTLGYLYRAGAGIAQDDVRALGLFEKACAAGEATGCRFLASMYENGWGVRSDAARARRLAKKACELDSLVCEEEPQ